MCIRDRYMDHPVSSMSGTGVSSGVDVTSDIGVTSGTDVSSSIGVTSTSSP